MYGIREVVCAKCKKIFCPAALHVFVEYEKFYCSWTCFNHRNDGKGKRRVLMLSEDGEILKVFDNTTKAAIHMDTQAKYIQKACREQARFKGYLWRYQEVK